MLTAGELRKLIRYCPETGQFWWVVRRGPRKAGAVAGGDHSVGCGVYREIRINGQLHLGHRLAWLYVHGSPVPEGLEIDHVDGDGTNNRFSNLRIVTSSGNKHNMSKRSDNTSGVVGVNWHKAGGRWMASIMHEGVSHYIGLYSDFEDAVKARKEAEVAFEFHPNHGR